MRKRTRRQIMAVALSAVLAMGMAAVPALAGGTETTQAGFILNRNGILHPLDKAAQGEGWSYDGNKTLTLDGFNGTGLRLVAVRNGDNLTVELLGDNTIMTGTYDSAIESFGFSHKDYQNSGYYTFTGGGSLLTDGLYTKSGYNFLDCEVTVTDKITESWIWVDEGAVLNVEDGDTYMGTLGLTGPDMPPKIVVNGGVMNITNSNESAWNDERIVVTGGGEIWLKGERLNGALRAKWDSNLIKPGYEMTDFDGTPLILAGDPNIPTGIVCYTEKDFRDDNIPAQNVRIIGTGAKLPSPETAPGPDDSETDKPDPEKPGTATDSNVDKPDKATDSNAKTSTGSKPKPATRSSSGSGNSMTAKATIPGPGTNLAVGAWTGGQWKMDENGWWFQGTDGNYPRAGWAQLEWNGQNLWYHFGEGGYMDTGWFQDGGIWYYLHAQGDGNRGFMHTGWNEIDGKWYYFHTGSADSTMPMGAMLANTTTPDGYQVGSDGAWIP